ncbi:MAG: Branched-chain amino acid transport system permease protein LivM [uncultured Thermomicrobiales bacterium]|uniref:Branched-chain amino acid transport system permease protein LivM n=1 Tax=uncultured Thermomicrobiales bacterium TaxID=1645740 RepID=A0A6J4VC51_9BACT|nr:MAG: Branched-chain amino acid transport system permease protein LivM [uncultured Thermomicrobiales bacterium]
MIELLATNETLLRLMAINAILALSIYLTLACGQLSLANAAFMGIGAYLSAVLTLNRGWPFPAVLLAAMAAPAVVALIVGLPALRLRGVFLAIATIGLGEVLRVVIINVRATGGAEGISRIPVKTQGWHLALALAAAAFIAWRLRGSRMGYAFEAIREDETVARTMGINTTFYKLTAFILGAALAGLAGALRAHFVRAITPADFGFALATEILTFAIVGGVVSFLGPILGAVLLTILPELLRYVGLPPGWPRLLLNGTILLLVILFLPNGLISLVTGRRRREAPLSSSDPPDVTLEPERRVGADVGAARG